MTKHFISLLTLFFLGTAALSGQNSLLGVWKTIDDETGQAKSHVEIYENGSKYYGKVVKLLQKPADTICDKCPGNKKNKLVLGMVIVEQLEKHKDYWKGGSILDPTSGNVYGCSMWFENGKTDELKVRGKHWTGLYRTQTWYRVK